MLYRYYGAEKRGKNQKKGRGRRPSWFDMSYDPDEYIDVEIAQEKATPVQNVYFFKKGTSLNNLCSCSTLTHCGKTRIMIYILSSWARFGWKFQVYIMKNVLTSKKK